MKVLFFSPDFAIDKSDPDHWREDWNGAGFYRCVLPCRSLKRHGIDARTTPVLLQSDQTGRLGGLMPDDSVWTDADVIVAHAWDVAGAAEQIERARWVGQKVIGDIDDLLWDLPLGHRAASWDPVAIAAKGERFLRHNLLACDAIVVSTPFLSSWIRDHWSVPAPYVARNLLDLENFTPEQPNWERPRVIGWNGALDWRANDFAHTRPWLAEVMEEFDLRFLWIGERGGNGPEFAERIGIDPARLDTRPIRNFSGFRESRPLRGMDIQIIPLADHPFNHAKSALKGLESAAWGVPFAADAIGEYRMLFGKHLSLEDDLRDLLASRTWREETLRRQREVTFRWNASAVRYLGGGSLVI